MTGPYSAAFGAIHHEDERGFLFTVAPVSCATEVANALNAAHERDQWRANVSVLLNQPDADVVRAREGGADEDLIQSLVLTLAKTRRMRDAALGLKIEPAEALPFPVEVKVWPREEGEPDPVAFVLSLAAKPWVLAGIASELRGASATFPQRTEAELAAALHWLLVHVLTPGSGGMETVMARIKAMRKESTASEKLSGTAPGLVVTDGLED